MHWKQKQSFFPWHGFECRIRLAQARCWSAYFMAFCCAWKWVLWKSLQKQDYHVWLSPRSETVHVNIAVPYFHRVILLLLAQLANLANFSFCETFPLVETWFTCCTLLIWKKISSPEHVPVTVMGICYCHATRQHGGWSHLVFSAWTRKKLQALHPLGAYTTKKYSHSPVSVHLVKLKWSACSNSAGGLGHFN